MNIDTLLLIPTITGITIQYSTSKSAETMHMQDVHNMQVGELIPGKRGKVMFLPVSMHRSREGPGKHQPSPSTCFPA